MPKQLVVVPLADQGICHSRTDCPPHSEHAPVITRLAGCDLLYHDMAFRLGKGTGDLKKFAAALGSLDWRRDGDLFKSFMTKKIGKGGDDQLSLNSAGASVRRELLKTIRSSRIDGTSRGSKEIIQSPTRAAENLASFISYRLKHLAI